MPPKKGKKKKDQQGEDKNKPPAFQKDAILCHDWGVGPKYKLKPVIGYVDHCPSKFRGPAYSVAFKQPGLGVHSDSPGPIYYPRPPKTEGGFSIRFAQRGEDELECSPGPYKLPDPMRNPAFSMSWRSPLRKVVTSAGPYNLPGGLNGPSFSIIPRQDPIECKDGGPGPSPPFSVDAVKPRAPAFTIGWRQKPEAETSEVEERSPGPAYYPENPNKGAFFSIGVKHNPCIQPYITECDKEAC